jgi:hypothetical protein
VTVERPNHFDHPVRQGRQRRPSNYNQNWVDFTAWDAANGTCSNNNYTTKTSRVNNGKTWTPKNHNPWNGCVWDRDKDCDTLNPAPTPSNTATLFPTEQWSACPVPLKALSYDWTALKNLIDAMTPNGNTNQGIGVAWAWQSLAQTAQHKKKSPATTAGLFDFEK